MSMRQRLYGYYRIPWVNPNGVPMRIMKQLAAEHLESKELMNARLQSLLSLTSSQ